MLLSALDGGPRRPVAGALPRPRHAANAAVWVGNAGRDVTALPRRVRIQGDRSRLVHVDHADGHLDGVVHAGLSLPNAILAIVDGDGHRVLIPGLVVEALARCDEYLAGCGNRDERMAAAEGIRQRVIIAVGGCDRIADVDAGQRVLRHAPGGGIRSDCGSLLAAVVGVGSGVGPGSLAAEP